MAEKVLSMDLKYKGKLLTYARSQSDFTNKFYIGSDRNIFWQILDSTFPKKHLFVSKEGRNFVFHLTHGMTAEVKKGDKILTTDELRSQRMLTNDRLIVDETTSGSVKFLNDWEVAFSFRNPFIKVLTAEEIALRKDYGRYAPMDPGEKFTVTFTVVGALLTILGVMVLNYHFSYIGTINADQYSLVRAIQAETPEPVVADMGKGAAPAQVVPEEEAGDAQGNSDHGGGGYGPANAPLSARGTFGPAASRGFGGGGGGGGMGSAIFSAIQQSRIGGGSGSGLLGSSGGGGGYSGTAIYNAFGSGNGGGGNGTGSGGPGSLGDIYSGASLGGSGGIHEVNPGAIAGRVGSGGVTRIYNNSDFQAVKRGFGGAVKIVQGSDSYRKSAGGESNAPLAAQLQSFVNAYKNRLNKIFESARFRSNIYGTMEFTILVSGGRVNAVQCTSIGNSSFTDDVVNQMKNEVKTWKIPVQDKVEYTFRMVFAQ